MITKRVAVLLNKKFHINPEAVSFEDWWKGLNVELEHHKDHNTTAQIVIDHLKEYPDYYQRLERLEKQAKAYWLNKTKPQITLSQNDT
jgi:hypothetical protein